MSESKQILKRYIPFAKTIGNMFGPNCEVVIHDLTTPQSSVIFTFNNHVTGREVGESFDHLVNKVLISDEFKEDYLAGYEVQTNDSRTIKSSTTLIRDFKQRVIGAFCINYDMSSMIHLKEMIDTLMPTNEKNKQLPINDESKQEAAIQNVEEITNQLIEQIVINHQHALKKRREKIELIRFMDEKGIFLMKGAVEKVAQQLGISKVTVYSYLDEVKKQHEKLNE